MNMNGIKDFQSPQHLDISHPERGFFGYLLRCRCHSEEDVTGNFVFLDDGSDCCARFPSSKRQREAIRAEWNGRISSYREIYLGQLYYVNEQTIERFINFMNGDSIDAIGIFLRKFMAGVRTTATPAIRGLVPLYAVSHVCQLTDDARMHWPHIHVLWSIKRD